LRRSLGEPGAEAKIVDARALRRPLLDDRSKAAVNFHLQRIVTSSTSAG